jgi:hypothetical protein
VFVGAPQRIGGVQARSTPWTFTFNAVFGFWLVGFAVFDPEFAVGDRFWGFAIACVGIVASVCLCVRLSELQSRAAQSCSALLVRWGEASMAIFVAHTLASAAIRIGLVKTLHVEDVTVHLLLGTVAGIGIPWALFLLSKRYHVPYLFAWPTQRRNAALTRPSRISIDGPAT